MTKTQLNTVSQTGVKGSALPNRWPQGSNEQTRKNEKHNYTKVPQKKYRIGKVNENILLGGLNWFHGTNLTLSSDVDQDTYMFGLHVKIPRYWKSHGRAHNGSIITVTYTRSINKQGTKAAR